MITDPGFALDLEENTRDRRLKPRVQLSTIASKEYFFLAFPEFPDCHLDPRALNRTKNRGLVRISHAEPPNFSCDPRDKLFTRENISKCTIAVSNCFHGVNRTESDVLFLVLPPPLSLSFFSLPLDDHQRRITQSYGLAPVIGNGARGVHDPPTLMDDA
jgi:hypothetical protein